MSRCNEVGYQCIRYNIYAGRLRHLGHSPDNGWIGLTFGLGLNIMDQNFH